MKGEGRVDGVEGCAARRGDGVEGGRVHPDAVEGTAMRREGNPETPENKPGGPAGRRTAA